MEEKKYVRCEIEGDIAVVIVDNQPALNALNGPTLTQLDETFTDLAGNKNVRGVIITGGGEKSFVAGADISEFLKVKGDEAIAFMSRGQRIFDKIEAFDRPVIAAVNGFALGGGNELALCCDIRIAAENAVFGQPEVNLGIIPGYGGTQRLPRRIVPKGQAVEEAKKLLKKILSKGPVAVQMAKKAINEGLTMSLREGLDLEARCSGVCFGTEDKDEGANAFLGKRAPKFKGK